MADMAVLARQKSPSISLLQYVWKKEMKGRGKISTWSNHRLVCDVRLALPCFSQHSRNAAICSQSQYVVSRTLE